MNLLLNALLELFSRKGTVSADVAYFNNLTSQVIRGGSKSPISDMIKVSGFPYQVIYSNQGMRYDN